MLLVTFSGLDASGKSTQVALTAEYLKQQGHRVCVLEPAHLSFGGSLLHARSTLQSLFKTLNPAPGPRSPEQQDTRRHTAPLTARKRRSVWAVRTVRFILYPLDCMRLSIRMQVLSLRGFTVIVCDRYVYDTIVNLACPTGWFGRVLRLLSRKPDLAFLLDASPDLVQRRRKERSANDCAVHYAAYQHLVNAGWELTPLPHRTIKSTQNRIRQALDDQAIHPITATLHSIRS